MRTQIKRTLNVVLKGSIFCVEDFGHISWCPRWSEASAQAGLWCIIRCCTTPRSCALGDQRAFSEAPLHYVFTVWKATRSLSPKSTRPHLSQYTWAPPYLFSLLQCLIGSLRTGGSAMHLLMRALPPELPTLHCLPRPFSGSESRTIVTLSGCYTGGPLLPFNPSWRKYLVFLGTIQTEDLSNSVPWCPWAPELKLMGPCSCEKFLVHRT